MESIVNPDHKKKYNKGEDLISQLPDDVLINILSHMEMFEAAKTGVLSTRWRYIWTNLDNLNFYPCHEFQDFSKLAFVDRVNQIVSLHSGSTIKQFRVCYDHLDDSDSSHIDEWVKFAMSKRVTNLELDLGTHKHWLCPNHTLTWDAFNISYFGSRVDLLTSLSLTSVNIDGSSIELFLSKFHGLERLLVEYSQNLVSLRVGDSCKKLKYLAIRNCPSMETLEVGAKNLVYFDFTNSHGNNEVVYYHSLPSLVEASLGGKYCNSLQISSFREISTFSSQLVKLSLNISKEACFNYYKLPSFQNVKHLELIISVFSLEDLARFGWLLCACPAVLELELKAHHQPFSYKKDICWDWKSRVPPSTKHFSLYFLQPMPDSFNAIDVWIKLAFAAKVEKLVLHTHEYDKVTPYALQCGIIMDFPRKTRLKSLKSLYLRNVDVSGEVVELVLLHCCRLEDVRIEGSDQLVSLKVTQTSTKLKSLAISRCRNMQSLDICASNLLNLEFSGPETANVAYNGVPSLVEAVFSGGYCHNRLLPNFNHISCFSNQLVKLSLHLVKVCENVEYPTLSNVKHLELSATPDDHESLLPLASLAMACPILHRLKLEIWWKCSCSKLSSNEDVKYTATPKEVENEITRSYNLANLKIFEWVEYEGIDHSEDIELALYIIKNASTLHKFICHTTNPWYRFNSYKDLFRARAIGREINYSDFLEYRVHYSNKHDLKKMNKSVNASRRRAQHLASYLPSRVDVCIM